MKAVFLSLASIFALSLSALAQDAAPGMTNVVMETSMGTVVIELNGEKAPGTVANFLQYVDDEFYDNTIFHRVIEGFMVQGGGFDAEAGEQKVTRDEIQNEAANGLKNTIGTLAMARRGDPHSASAQFFVNVGDNAFLNNPGQDGWGYCVFGKVVEGMDVIEAIEAVKTGRRILKPLRPGGVVAPAPMGDVPLEDVVIVSIRRADADANAAETVEEPAAEPAVAE